MTEIARHAANDTTDVIVWTYGTSFYAGQAKRGFICLDRTMPYASEAEARAEANRIYMMVRTGVTTTAIVSLYRHDALSTMHPRQAEVLRTVPRKVRAVIIDRAHLLQNTNSGGTLSQWLDVAVREYRANGAHELRRMSRRDNHAAMRACGCEACKRDADRAEGV